MEPNPIPIPVRSRNRLRAKTGKHELTTAKTKARGARCRVPCSTYAVMAFIPLVALTARAMPEQENTITASKAAASYVLGANDRITIRCLNADEFPSSPIRIDGDGQVTLPFVGRMKVAGFTVREAESELTTRLSEFLVDPQVAVNLVESRSQPVSVFGAVNTPGTYELEGPITLTEVLSRAGGLRKDAGRIVTVKRYANPGLLGTVMFDAPGTFTVTDIDIEKLVRGKAALANIEIRAYDVISVPEADVVYVVGQVHKPGAFAMTGRENFTVLQAVSLAEGLERSAAPKKARILKNSHGSNRAEVPVNLDSILSGRSPDMVLHADDVLFVPNSAAKSAGIRTIDALIQMTTGVVVYGRY